MSGGEASEKVEHPWFARLYMLIATSSEDRYRTELLEGISGRVVEVGSGHGPNFPHYPKAVESVLAVEPEPLMRAEAEKAADKAPVPIEVVDGLADDIPAPDGAFDCAVVSLVLCSVPDQERALAEIHRVLKPGGELRFYEHVVSHRPRLAALQRLADAIIWPRVAGGCHLARDTSSVLERSGFAIETRRRLGYPPVMPLPHILGRARRV